MKQKICKMVHGCQFTKRAVLGHQPNLETELNRHFPIVSLSQVIQALASYGKYILLHQTEIKLQPCESG